MQVEDKERKVAFAVICITIFLSGFLYTYLIPLVPSYHLITGAYFSTAEVALLFASYSFGETLHMVARAQAFARRAPSDGDGAVMGMQERPWARR